MEEIIKGNKICAGYCGTIEDGLYRIPFKDGVLLSESHLKFHESFDWQIPVWSRVMKELLKFSGGKAPFMGSLAYSGNEEIKLFGQEYHKAVDNDDKMSAFRVLVRAIEFIEANKKNNG